MRIINTYIGIKKRINDLLGWKTNTNELTVDSVQDAAMKNFQRYGKGLSGNNTKGAVLGNNDPSNASFYNYNDSKFILKAYTSLVTNKGNIINTARNATINNVADGSSIYFKYDLALDTTHHVDVQNSKSVPSAWDEKSHISSVDGNLSTSVPLDNYVLLGQISDGVFVPNYPVQRQGYHNGYFDIITDISFQTSSDNTIALQLTKKRIYTKDGFITKITDMDSTLINSATCTVKSIPLTGNIQTITPTVKITT